MIADMRHDFVQTLNSLLDDLDLAGLAAGIDRLAAEGRDRLAGAGVTLDGIEEIVELDMLYVGQTHTVATPLSAGATSVGAIRNAFEESYRRDYGRVLDGIPCRVMNLRVSVIGRRPGFDLSVLAPSAEASEAGAERPGRPVYVQGAWHDARVYDRLLLPVGAVIPGPAILEQADATTFIDPGLAGRVDDYGNVIVEREK